MFPMATHQPKRSYLLPQHPSSSPIHSRLCIPPILHFPKGPGIPNGGPRGSGGGEGRECGRSKQLPSEALSPGQCTAESPSSSSEPGAGGRRGDGVVRAASLSPSSGSAGCRCVASSCSTAARPIWSLRRFSIIKSSRLWNSRV